MTLAVRPETRWVAAPGAGASGPPPNGHPFGGVARRPRLFYDPAATDGVSRDNTLPPGLRRTLDGYEVGRAFERGCPSCGEEYDPGDRLVVRAERAATATDWDAVTVVCAECGQRSLPADAEGEPTELVLVGVDLVTRPMTRVLDGDSAELLDYAAAGGDDE